LQSLVKELGWTDPVIPQSKMSGRVIPLFISPLARNETISYLNLLYYSFDRHVYF
jgi:hypothetical protein